MVRRTTSVDPDFQTLAGELTVFLAVLNGERDEFFAQHNKTESIKHAVVAYLDDKLVGCGAFRSVESGEVEIKRMYVRPSARGNGVGRRILNELESWAVDEGFDQAILETSRRLESAVHLYLGAGYSVIANYGAYIGIDDSVCMRKHLG